MKGGKTIWILVTVMVVFGIGLGGKYYFGLNSGTGAESTPQGTLGAHPGHAFGKPTPNGTARFDDESMGNNPSEQGDSSRACLKVAIQALATYQFYTQMVPDHCRGEGVDLKAFALAFKADHSEDAAQAQAIFSHQHPSLNVEELIQAQFSGFQKRTGESLAAFAAKHQITVKEACRRISAEGIRPLERFLALQRTPESHSALLKRCFDRQQENQASMERCHLLILPERLETDQDKADPEKLRLLSAAVFLEHHHTFTREYPAYCGTFGVDISSFVVALERIHAEETAQARKIISRYPAIDLEKNYQRIQPQMREMAAKSIHRLATNHDESTEAICHYFSSHGPYFAESVAFSKCFSHVRERLFEKKESQ